MPQLGLDTAKEINIKKTHGSIEVYRFISEGLESCREEILRTFFFFSQSVHVKVLPPLQASSLSVQVQGPSLHCVHDQFLIPSHPPPCRHTQHLALRNLFTLKQHTSSCPCGFLGHFPRAGHTVLDTMDIVPLAIREHWLPGTISRCYCALSMMVTKATLPQRMQQCLDDNFFVVMFNVLIL